MLNNQNVFRLKLIHLILKNMIRKHVRFYVFTSRKILKSGSKKKKINLINLISLIS